MGRMSRCNGISPSIRRTDFVLAFPAPCLVMCDRFACPISPEVIARLFKTTGSPADVAASWNVAPGQKAMVVRCHPKGAGRHLDVLTWGLVPHATRHLERARKPINARAETVAVAPVFRDAFSHRRCLVPAQVFYEWQTLEKAPKQPFAIARRDGNPLALAGIWQDWRGSGENQWAVVSSFAIIVIDANDDLAAIHQRMPVIVEPEDWPLWLGETEGDARHLLAPAATGILRIWPIGPRVNQPENDDAEVLDSLPHHATDSARS